MMEYVKNENSNETKKQNKKATLKWQLRTQKNEKVSNCLHVFIIIFHFFNHFLKAKSQFCSRSSLNAGKTQEAREKTLKNSKYWEQIKAQSWKLQAK